MLPIRCELILAVILVASAVSAQTIVPGTAASSNLPSPPPPPAAPKPATPQRIIVGSEVQSNYLGPEGRWLPSSRRLSEADITAGEQFLTVNPDDFCTRARLIAFAYPTPSANRMDHLIWMIRNHPEWEGFILGPSHGLAEPRSGDERANYDRLKQAWLEQVNPQQKRGIVLHNAAMFFAIREPVFAATLLRRAIAVAPDVPLYAERLGTVYAYAFFPEPQLRGFHVDYTP